VKRTSIYIVIILAAALIVSAGCGKKKEEPAKPAPTGTTEQTPSAGGGYYDTLTEMAAKAEKEVEARGVDAADVARARELVQRIKTYNYSVAGYVPEEPVSPSKWAPFIMPPTPAVKPKEGGLEATVHELWDIGLAAAPALMRGYLAMADVEPRRYMLASFRGMTEGMDLIMPFLMEILAHDPSEELKQTAGITVQAIVLLAEEAVARAEEPGEKEKMAEKVRELGAGVAPQLVEIALTTDDANVCETALSEVYEFQTWKYVLSAEVVESLRKGMEGKGYSDYRAVLIARCLMEHGDEGATKFLVESLRQPTDMAVASWTLHLLGKKKIAGARKAAERFLRDKENIAGREEAAWTLGNLVDEAGLRDEIIGALTDALKTEKEPGVYMEIAEALVKSGEGAAVEMLLEQSRANETKEMRIQCIEALGRGLEAGLIKDEAAAKVVTSFLEGAKKDGDFSLRMRYVEALARGGAKAPEDLPGKIVAACVSLMEQDPQFAVRAEAAAALGKFPKAAVTNFLLEALLAEPTRYVRVRIIRSLGERGSGDAIAPVVEILKTAKDSEIISTCAEALSKLEGFSIKALFDAYLSPVASNVAKINILMALRQMKDGEAIARFLIERAPAEGSDERRREIIRDIGVRVPPGNPLEKEAIAALEGVLTASADTESLRAAVEALGSYRDKSTIEAIIAAAKKDPEVRLEAVRALMRINEAREDVLQFYLEIAAGVNFANFEIYGEQLEGIKAAVSSMDKGKVSRMVKERCLSEKDPKIRRAALAMSFAVDDPKFDECLTGLARDAKEPLDARSGALLGLGMRKSRQSVEFLMTMLTSEETDLAESAAYALGAIGDMQAFRPLLDTVKLLRNAPPHKERLKAVAIFALEQLTGLTGEKSFGDNAAAWERWYARRRTMGQE
jgi:HEAT repeat protein